jgi:hypothetical protein
VLPAFVEMLEKSRFVVYPPPEALLSLFVAFVIFCSRFCCGVGMP